MRRRRTIGGRTSDDVYINRPLSAVAPLASPHPFAGWITWRPPTSSPVYLLIRKLDDLSKLFASDCVRAAHTESMTSSSSYTASQASPPASPFPVPGTAKRLGLYLALWTVRIQRLSKTTFIPNFMIKSRNFVPSEIRCRLLRYYYYYYYYF